MLFGPMACTEEDYADERWQRRSGINRIMFELEMFLAGTWGADFHPDLRPLATETVLLPHKGTDVFETDLPEHLRRLGTTQQVIAGMTANLCCESTGRHAMEHGYDVTFAWDAIGAENLPAYEASIRVNYPLIANAVMSVDDSSMRSTRRERLVRLCSRATGCVAPTTAKSDRSSTSSPAVRRGIPGGPEGDDLRKRHVYSPGRGRQTIGHNRVHQRAQTRCRIDAVE